VSPSPSAVAPDLLPTRGQTGRLPAPGLSGLRELAGAVRPVAIAGERVLPVLPALESLLPERGLRRGSVIATSGRAGATSLALALISAASAQGSWCAAVAVGQPAVGLVAATEAGISLERFPVISASGGNGPGGWSWVVAALLDAVDIVVAWPPPHVRSADARRLAARGRERGAVLVLAGVGAGAGAGVDAGTGTRAGWPAPVDVELRVSKVAWHGVGRGHGRLEARSVEVVAGGRGAAARERRADLWLPPRPQASPATRPHSIVCTQRVVKSAEMAEITTLRVQQTVG
jgi:hypothetical protein